MPWANNEALPESVKVLPSEAQSIFRAAANSALTEGKAEEAAMQIGWGAVKNAGWSKDKDDKWMKAHSEPETHSMDMEIFAAGNWNGDTFTKEDLNSIVANFEELKSTVKPFLKLGGVNPHADLVHQPAIGWVDSLRVNGDRIIATVKDIPKIVFEAINRKLYRRVSSEIYAGYKNTEGKVYNFVLRAVAILGSAIPAVSTLEDLTKYLTEQGQSEKVLSFGFDSEDHKIIMGKEETIEMEQEKVKEFEDKIAAAEAEAAEAKAKLKTFEEEQRKSARTASEQNCREFCEEAVKQGRMPPFVRDAIFPKDKPSLIVFAEDNSVTLPFGVLKDFISKVKTIDFSEKGADHKDKKDEPENPGERLHKRAQALLDAKTVKSYSDAMQKVLAEDAELAAEYAKDRGKNINA